MFLVQGNFFQRFYDFKNFNKTLEIQGIDFH